MMDCPHCETTLSFDEPRMGFTVYTCEECDLRKEYDYGTLVFQSNPDQPMKPPVRLEGGRHEKDLC